MLHILYIPVLGALCKLFLAKCIEEVFFPEKSWSGEVLVRGSLEDLLVAVMRREEASRTSTVPGTTTGTTAAAGAAGGAVATGGADISGGAAGSFPREVRRVLVSNDKVSDIKHVDDDDDTNGNISLILRFVAHAFRNY
jgi:hypothetical protein